MLKTISLFVIVLFLFAGCGNDRTDTTADETATDTEAAGEQTTEEAADKDYGDREKLEVSDKSLYGSWINSETEMGFTLGEGGSAESINMATLEYNGWKLDGDTLILASQSVGVENPVAVDEVYIIREVADDHIVLSPADNPDTKWTYKKK